MNSNFISFNKKSYLFFNLLIFRNMFILIFYFKNGICQIKMLKIKLIIIAFVFYSIKLCAGENLYESLYCYQCDSVRHAYCDTLNHSIANHFLLECNPKNATSCYTRFGLY